MRCLFGVEGLACPSCARGLERRLARLSGVVAAKVHYLTSSALIEWDEAQLRSDQLAACVKDAGYRLIERHRPVELADALGTQIRALSVRLAVAVFFGMWVMALALILYTVALPAGTAWIIAAVSGIFSLPVMLFSAAPMFRMGWISLNLQDTSTDLLFSGAAIGALTLSLVALVRAERTVWFDAATMLVTALLVARLLDAITRRSAIRSLIAMEAAAPEEATIRENGVTLRVPATGVAVGSTVLVDAGEALAVDGVVVSGDSLINRSILTGESVPVPIGPGDRIEAGCINLVARLVVEVDRAYGEREVDRLGGSIAVEIAAAGAEQGEAERWTRFLMRAIPIAALASAIIVQLRDNDINITLITALTLLAGLCPCALALAVPLVRLRIAAIGAAQGFRIREPKAFESLVGIRTIVFDKTGTITQPNLCVVAVEPADGHCEGEVLMLAAEAETGIRHPIAEAIIAITGEIGEGGQRGSRSAAFTNAEGAVTQVEAAAARADGRTAVSVIRDGKCIGNIVLEDTLLPNARRIVHDLQAMHLSIYLASGDAVGPTERIGKELGLAPDRIRAALTPSDKARLIGELGPGVAVVGDGINDALAFAVSDCGISVSGAHAAARQMADIAIERGGVDRLSSLIGLSKAASGIVYQNLVLSVAYNVLLIPAAIFGYIGPGLAAFTMAASSFSVCANSLRLRVSQPAVPVFNTDGVDPLMEATARPPR